MAEDAEVKPATISRPKLPVYPTGVIGGRTLRTSAVWPAIGCPTDDGVIGPGHTTVTTASTVFPLTRPTKVVFGVMGTGSWAAAVAAGTRAAPSATAAAAARRRAAGEWGMVGPPESEYRHGGGDAARRQQGG